MRKISAAIQAAGGRGAPVDALFLPGGQENLEMIARLLPQAEIDTEKVKLIGTGGMDYPNAGRDARAGRRLVSGARSARLDRFLAEVRQELRRRRRRASPASPTTPSAWRSPCRAAAEGQRYDGGRSSPARAASPASTAPSACCPTAAPTASLAILEVQKFGAGVVDAPPGLGRRRRRRATRATSAMPRSNLNFN